MTEAERIELQPTADLSRESCVACGSAESSVRFRTSDLLYRTTGKEFAVAQCARCGLLRLSPPPGPDEFALYYPRNYWFDPSENAAGRLEEAYRRLVLHDHVRFVKRALGQTRESGPLLDVGCGGGLFLGMLRRAGISVLGLDLSVAAAAMAQKRHSVPAVAGDLDAAPFACESCRAITMFHVLEHVPRPQQYLAAARRLLRPNGRLVVQVPNAASWQFAIFGRRWNGVDAPRHLHLFRASDLERLLASAGFSIVRRKYFSLRDNPAGLATSLAPSLDPMARRVRGLRESGPARLLKDLLYFGLVLIALPFTALEAAFGAGSTVMIEARKSP